jgi:integrase
MLVERYLREKGPLLSDRWRRQVDTQTKLFLSAWTSDLLVRAIDQHLIDKYVSQRRRGTILPEGGKKTGVRDGTIHAEIRTLKVVINWGRKKRGNSGRPLIESNPLDGLQWPREKNVRRPVASHDRYLRTIAQTAKVDPDGRLRCALALARYTGRRQGSICALMASDLLLDTTTVRVALATEGMDEGMANHFPHGGIRWRRETDKTRTAWIVPVSAAARAEIDRYLSESPRLGEVPLFPSDADPMVSIRIDVMGHRLMVAEKRAKVPKLEHGRWHPYRRLWATERKSVPIQDVAAAGGWNSIETVSQIYQQADPAGVLRAVEGI